MNIETLDFRNGKYQGYCNSSGKRHGLGIFIDDDLTFYASNWNQNQLHGQTLMYISHGKYIYGEWQNNSLSGLAVFRCGDTVLVGQFRDNFPVGRCMLIFQKFNFVCVLEEGTTDDQWNVIDSGTIKTHKMLLKYIEKIGISVPDHYFSLTKFVCNFTLNNSCLKTFPCYVSCCYFGFVNGLAMVFNCNNGLVAIGKHSNEEVTQFGGKFQNSRNGQEGNFQFGGERINYTGQRPVHKIYPIFQRLHKKSLNFINEYFDSKIKYFTSVENFLRSQLKNISEDCKSKFSFSAQLNDSLDYQEYNEEQSLKLNENRDSLYENIPQKEIKKGSINSTPKKNTEKIIGTPQQSTGKVEQNDNYGRFFRKSSIKQEDQSKLSHQYIKTNDCKSTSKVQHEEPQVYMVKRSPFRPHKQERSRQPSQDQVSPFVIKKDSRIQLQKEQESKEVKRDKSRPNNHRYLMNYAAGYPQSSSSPLVKNNQIYRETPKKEESPESFKLPTFKALGEEIDQKKLNKYQIDQPLPKNTLVKENLGTQSILTSKKHNNAHRPATPTYEDIEERRKRILKSFQQVNEQPQVQNQLYQQTNDINDLGQYESPFNAAVFSLPKEEAQKGGGFIPLSIYNKEERVPTYQVKQENRRASCRKEEIEKENLKTKIISQIPEKSRLQHKINPRQIQIENQYCQYSAPAFAKLSKAEEFDQFTPYRQEPIPRNSPKRPRKSYQYIYE